MAYQNIYIGNKPYTIFIENTLSDPFLYSTTDQVQIKALPYNAYAQLDIRYNDMTENLEVRILALSSRGKYLIEDTNAIHPACLIPEIYNGHATGGFIADRSTKRKFKRRYNRGGYYVGDDPSFVSYEHPYIINAKNYTQTFYYPIKRFINENDGYITISDSCGINGAIDKSQNPKNCSYKIRFNLWGHGRYKKTWHNKITIMGSDLSYL